MTVYLDAKEELDNQFTKLNTRIEIDIRKQTLLLIDNQVHTVYPISTAKNGTGQSTSSGCTPLGHHIVRAKIGNNCQVNTVFIGRRPSGEVYSADLASRFPKRDWILTRILWLSGLQVGYNRLGNVDTMRRYIYIHGTPDTEPMGVPRSHGCIRMHNSELISLFDQIKTGTRVLIKG